MKYITGLLIMLFLGESFSEKVTIKEDNEYTIYLLSVKKNIKNLTVNSGVYTDNNTELTKKLSSIKLAYKPKVQSIGKMIGASPGGIFVPDKGWSGHKLLFTYGALICSYSYLDLNISGGYVDIENDMTPLRIGKKLEHKFISGTKKVGYAYSVNWYSEKEVNMLDCALEKLDEKILKNMEWLAEDIERRK